MEATDNKSADGEEKEDDLALDPEHDLELRGAALDENDRNVLRAVLSGNWKQVWHTLVPRASDPRKPAQKSHRLHGTMANKVDFHFPVRIKD